MRWDFSLQHRAEDRWADARLAAEEQRRLRELAADAPSGSPWREASRRLLGVGLGGRVRRWLAGIAGFLTLLLAIAVVAAGAQTLAEAARNLAENVLGPGSVKSVRFLDERQMLYIRWESATYRGGLSVPEMRDQLFGEAELATGSILGQLRNVATIRFTIVHGTRMLATGENRRGSGIEMIFAPDLGGGMLEPAATKPVQSASSSSQTSGGTSAKSW